jgi:ParB/RepB/Spo0J family partition protein
MHDVIEIYTDKIKLPVDNMRTEINRDELYDLADDIKKNGLINPITVRPLGDDYELVAGQRRYLAHQIGGMIKIRCIVRNLSDDEALAVMTSENLARVDVNPVDEANHVGRLMKLHNDDVQHVAKIVNRSVSWVKDRCLVALMPDYMQEALAQGKLKLGVALNLCEITDEAILRMWVEIAVRDGTSVAQSRYWVDGWRLNRLSNNVDSSLPPSGFQADVPHVVKFKCAIDGKEYDARQFRQLFVHESNIGVFSDFVTEYNKIVSETESLAVD